MGGALEPRRLPGRRSGGGTERARAVTLTFPGLRAALAFFSGGLRARALRFSTLLSPFLTLAALRLGTLLVLLTPSPSGLLALGLFGLSAFLSLLLRLLPLTLSLFLRLLGAPLCAALLLRRAFPAALLTFILRGALLLSLLPLLSLFSLLPLFLSGRALSLLRGRLALSSRVLRVFRRGILGGLGVPGSLGRPVRVVRS